jgi:hypothetical protein
MGIVVLFSLLLHSLGSYSHAMWQQKIHMIGHRPCDSFKVHVIERALIAQCVKKENSSVIRW